MVRPSDPVKLTKLINILKNVPGSNLPDAMMMANYSAEEVSDLSFRRFLQRALPGHSLEAFRALVAGGDTTIWRVLQRQGRWLRPNLCVLNRHG